MAMLKAARVQGRPIIVIAMTTAAMPQATAIQRPPKTIQKTLSRRDTADIGFLGELTTMDLLCRAHRQRGSLSWVRDRLGYLDKARPYRA